MVNRFPDQYHLQAHFRITHLDVNIMKCYAHSAQWHSISVGELDTQLKDIQHKDTKYTRFRIKLARFAK